MEQKVVCKNCSAPLDYRDGDTIAVCIYCNETNKFGEEKVTDEHYCLDLFIEQQNVRSTLVGDLLKIPGVSDNIETGLIIKNMNLIYLPFYITQIHGNVKWKGVGRDAEFSGHDGRGYTNIHFITKKEIELTQIQNNIKSAKSDKNILKAELSYLKRPDRIEKIALNRLGLREILPTDIWNFKDLVDVTVTLSNGEKK